MKQSERLMSLDALRGFDMLFIMGFASLVVAVCGLWPSAVTDAAAASMSHVAWDGFAHHDTIFPLFLFIAGVSFPYSVAKQRAGGMSEGRIYAKIVRRGLTLVVLGMVYNGLFKLDFENLRIASVLGRIGLAWSIAAVLYLNFGVKTRAAIAVAVLAGYGALSALVAAPDAAGAGPLTFEGNLAGYIDRQFLPGKLIYGSFDPEGLLSTVPAVVTAMLGMFTGEFVRRSDIRGGRKTLWMAAAAAALLAAGLNQMIIAQGFAAQAMRLVVLGAALNIALDPVFIFALNMGVRGAALTTVLSQMASAAGAVIFLRGRRAAIRLERGGLSLPAARKILTLGFTPFAIIAIDNVMLIAMNAVLQRYGGALEGDRLVTCAVIAQSFMLVMTMPLGGISGGTQAILSYNYGARQFGRVRDAQKKIFRLCMGFTAVMFVLARVAGPLFVRLFTKDAQVAEISAWAIRVCTLAAIPLGAQYEIVDGFTALGQVRLSFPLSFFRKAVYFAALFILPACFGARAAFYAEPVSDVLGPLASAIAYKLCIGPVLSDGHARV